METTGTKDMGIMGTMVTVTRGMADMEAMITLVTTTIMDMVTTTVSKLRLSSFSVSCCLFPPPSEAINAFCPKQINPADTASRHGVALTPTATSRINGGNPRLQVGM